MIAPIVLFCYNRLWHLQQTIKYLQQNELASQSQLIIYSDAAKDVENQKAVGEVRNYIQHITGFQSLEIIKRNENWGLAKSIIAGVTEVLEKYGKVIVMEDDLICTPNFLNFMNEALNLYENQKEIYSITGWTPKIQVPESYTEDIYLTQRPASWSWATWKNRWQKADWEVSDFDNFKRDQQQQSAFNQVGEDVSPMLKKQQKGIINSWAIRWTYTLFQQQGYCVYPVHPKVHNIGTDSSGENVSRFSKYNYETYLDDRPYQLPNRPKPDSEMEQIFRDYFRLSPIRKVINWWKGY